MGVNAFEIKALHNNLLAVNATQASAGARASEFPVVADNINGQLSRYPLICGVWDSANIGAGPGSIATNSWAQANGSGDSDAFRPFGGFFIRSAWFTDVADGINNYRSGYIGSFAGGLVDFSYGTDPNGSSVDYEPLYGHGAGTSIAVTSPGATFNQQYRDSSSIPVDAAHCNVVNHNSAYTKTRYMPPSTFILHISSATATLGSGNVRMFVEERPSLQVATMGSLSPYDSSGTLRGIQSDQGIGNGGALKAAPIPATSYNNGNPYTANLLYPFDYFAVSGIRKLNTRALTILLAKVFDNTSNAYGWRYEEDGTDQTVQSVDTQTEYLWQRSATQVGATTALGDFRVRNAAYFTINEEYYGFVMDTRVMIFSSKASMIPLLFFDLKDTWTSSTAPRVAGVAVKSDASKIWFLSEDGFLAVYDFTVFNGQLSLLANATAPLANESYGALAISSNDATIYALYGTMIADPRATSTGVATPRIAVRPYTVGSNTWGALDVATQQGRHNVRSLQEMVRLRDGRLAIICEDTAVNGGNTLNAMVNAGSTNNVAWQLVMYDPTAVTKWNSVKIRGGVPLITATISNLQLTSNVVTVTVANSFAAGDHVTINGITNGSYTFLNGAKLTVLTAGLSGTAFTANFTHTNVASTAITAGKATRGLQYGDDVVGIPGASATTYSWFQNINAFVHDVNTNTVLIQGNWTASELFAVVLPVVGTSDPSATSVTAVGFNVSKSDGSGTNRSIIHSDLTAAAPCDIRHNRDFASGGSGSSTGNRTIFWYSQNAPTAIGSASTGAVPLYYAPPSFPWDGTTIQSKWTDRNATDASGFLSTWTKDSWSFGDLRPSAANVKPQWAFPTLLNGNYLHFVKILGSAGQDGTPANSLYGKQTTQTLTYIPTYWKWNGSAFTLADNWADAALSTHGYPVSATPNTGGSSAPNGVDILLPWGLIVQFGSTTGASFALQEFYTFNVAWGNTKFARKVRYPWAMFAGQTLIQTDTRTIATQTPISLLLNDTDVCTATFSGPNNLAPSASGGQDGWTTRITYPKLNLDNSANNAALVCTLSSNVLDQTHIKNVYMGSNSVTVGGFTYVASSNGSQAAGPEWMAFAASPGRFWKSNVNAASGPFLQLDFGAGNAQTIVAYSFRPYYDTADSSNNVPKSWTLSGSNDGVTFTTLDTRTNVPPARGFAFTFANGTAYRYYRLAITATGSGTSPALGMFSLYDSATRGAMNFYEISFLPHGSNTGSSGLDANNSTDGNLFLNNQFARGLKFEVNTGGGFVQITPLWRAHNGHVFTFARQEGVTQIRITCQTPYNYGTGTQGGTNSSLTAAFGPFYAYDYNVNQVTMNVARLGSNAATGQTPTNPAAGSFEANNLGVATDAVTVSIDGGSPSALSHVIQQNSPVGFPVTSYNFLYSNTQVEMFAMLGFWAFDIVPANCYKVHPYFGFVFFPGAGPHMQTGTMAGTNMAITYHWGKRI